MKWNILKRLWNEFLGKQFTPTNRDIITVKDLAERLKGETNSETLNNILEWQERNIIYWTERGYLDVLLTLAQPFILFGLLIILLWISIPLIMLLYLLFILFGLPLLISLLISFISILSLMILMITKANVVIRLCYIVVFSYPAYYIVRESLLNHLSAENVTMILNLSIINWSIFGISLFTIVYLFIIYKPFARQELRLKDKLKKIYELMVLTFNSYLPLSKMLEYRMGICRDYARLTAALLANLYPNNEILFFTFSGHVAAGIKINNNIYILDQKLPILKPESWLIMWNKKDAKVLRMIKCEKKISIELVGKILRKQDVKIVESYRKMFKELVEKVDKAIRESEDNITFTIKNGIFLFDISDNIIKDSLLRKIKLILQTELVERSQQIKDINIMNKNSDIFINIRLIT